MSTIAGRRGVPICGAPEGQYYANERPRRGSDDDHTPVEGSGVERRSAVFRFKRMPHTTSTSPPSTTLELLDALDASFAELRARVEAVKNGTVYKPARAAANGNGARGREEVSAERLRINMELAGLDRSAISSVFGVPVEVIEEWISGRRPIPSWVLPSIRILELLAPATRRKLITNPVVRARRKPANTHPFSQIEEL